MRIGLSFLGLLALTGILQAQENSLLEPELPRSARSESFTNLRLGSFRQREGDTARERLGQSELRTPQFSILATEGREQTDRLKQELAAGWNEMLRLTSSGEETFPPVHDTIQVLSNRKLTDESPAPLAIVSHENGTTIIHLAHTEAVDEQAQAVRTAAAYAALHTTQMQQHLPPWVATGLAAYVGQEKEPSETTNVARVAFAVWEPERGHRENGVALQSLDAASAAQIRYFLTSSQGAYALSFLGTVHNAVSEQKEELQGLTRQRPQLAAAEEILNLQDATAAQFETLVEQHAAAFAKWQENPNYDQPLLERISSREDIAAKQRHMVAVLGLLHQRELAARQRVVKVQEFRNGKLMQATALSPLAHTFSLEKLHSEITESPLARAIITDKNELLLPHEQEAIANFLGLDEKTFQLQWKENSWLLSCRLNSQETLQAWLEPNKSQPLRPLAKFATLKK